MPAYPHLFESDNTVDSSTIANHMRGLQIVGVPYTKQDLDNAAEVVKGKTKGEALIAYLLRLGKDMAEYEKLQK
jgi:cytochrome c oxidase cbb3-type subunit 2